MAITCTEGEVKISEFGSVRSKQSQTISLQEYVNKVRSNTFKAQVEEYRRLAALPGHEAEAQRVKDGMPCIVPAGVCSGGHAVKNLVKHSGLLQIDMDHTLLRTTEVCRLLCELPYVTVVHKSFSQNGVRAFVRVAAEDVMRNYEQLYAAVGEAVSRHAAHNYDSKCKILTQPSFYSWDADAYYNPDAETFKMQWGEETGKEAGTISETAANAGGTVSRGIISEVTDSGKAVSGGAISEVTDSGRTVSGGAISGVTDSGKTVSGGAISGVTDSGRTVSGGAISGVTDSGVTNSEKSASGA
ncbi:BT4734/BF3469 family protein, partial [Bacteroides eggerthii]